MTELCLMFRGARIVATRLFAPASAPVRVCRARPLSTEVQQKQYAVYNRALKQAVPYSKSAAADRTFHK